MAATELGGTHNSCIPSGSPLITPPLVLGCIFLPQACKLDCIPLILLFLLCLQTLQECA